MFSILFSCSVLHLWLILIALANSPAFGLFAILRQCLGLCGLKARSMPTMCVKLGIYYLILTRADLSSCILVFLNNLSNITWVDRCANLFLDFSVQRAAWSGSCQLQAGAYNPARQCSLPVQAGELLVLSPAS
jgi:hypothetical protein